MILSQRQYIRADRQLTKLYTIRRYNFPADKVLRKFGIVDLEGSISELETKIECFNKYSSGLTPIDLNALGNIAELLIMARLYLGMTQDELARGVGVTRQQISRLERTKYQTSSLKFIIRVKAFLEPKIEKRKIEQAPYEEPRRLRAPVIDVREIDKNRINQFPGRNW